MTTSRRRRRAARLAGVLIVPAAMLGLVVTPSATASCPGPQVALEERGVRVSPRRVGDVDHEKLLYDVSRAAPLRVAGSHLTFSCQDTFSSTQRGCAAPAADPVKPDVPMERPEVVLVQGRHSWPLGLLRVVGPDLSAHLDVRLPRGVLPGPAVLSVVEHTSRQGPQLDLVVA